MQLRDTYDWVVIGDHPGALLSACLAARLGLSVLVLKAGVSGARTSVSSNRQCLDPESNYVLGLSRAGRISGLLADCLSQLGIFPSEQEKIVSLYPQIITPHHRILFSAEDGIFRSELLREFGGDFIATLGLCEALEFSEAELLSYWRCLPERLTLPTSSRPEKRIESQNLETLRRGLEKALSSKNSAARPWFSAKKNLEHFPRTLEMHRFSNLCEGFMRAILGQGEVNPRLMDLVHSFVLARTGASFKGGLSAYREFLKTLARRLGANVPEGALCQRIFVEDGLVRGVQVASQGSMIQVGGAVLGCSLDSVREGIALGESQEVDRLKPSPTPLGWKMTLALTVHEEAIPPGLSPRMLWQEEDAPPLEIEMADPVDYAMADKKCRYLFLRTVLPFRAESFSSTSLRLMASRMFRQLTEIVPFVESHVQRIFPDFRVENNDFSEAYGFVSSGGGAVIPENLRCLSAGGVGFRSGVDGLFVATGESYPELGSLGPTVAALEALSTTAHRLGLPGPL